MANSIFVTLSTFAEYDRAPLRLLEESGIAFKLNLSKRRITREELLRDGRDATVVIAGVEPYDAQVLEQIPSLRCISRCGAGTDAIDLPAARARGIAILNTPDVPTQAVAELALSMILSLSRNLHRQANLMAARDWTRLESHLIWGRRVGVLGLGRIGKRVTELLTAFGAIVSAFDPYPDAAWAAVHGVPVVSLEELLSGNDVISLHAAGSPQYPLRLGAAEFARMKRGALVVNLARGSMIDEEALLEALISGHLGGAGLDVFREEPYRGPLCDVDSVILTPHSATLAVETRVAMEVECVDKAIRFVRGEIVAGERVA